MRLHEEAFHLAGTKNRMQLAVSWLQENDAIWELRRRGTPHEHTLSRDKDGNKLRDHYLPHIPIDAQVWARTWKAFSAMKKITGLTPSNIWEKHFLPRIEEVTASMKGRKIGNEK